MTKVNTPDHKDIRPTVLGNLLLMIRRLNIYILVIGPMVASLLLLGFLLFVGNSVYRGNMPEIYQAISGVIFLAVLSMSGVAQVYRREGPGPLGYPVFGIWPIVTGYLIVLICWISILYLIARICNLIIG